MTKAAPMSILIDLTKGLGFKPAVDGLISAMSGKIVLDVIKFDKQLAEKDPDYNATECTYKGDPISMSEYIEAKFGKEVSELVNKAV